MDALEHEEDNRDGIETIIFLHSLFHSSKESIPVVHYLPKSYHVIRPSFQPHDLSDFEESSAKVAELIRKTARRGKAHVVGLGIGAHIALMLAKSYPHFVSSLFLMGYSKHGALFQPVLAVGLYQVRKLLVRGTRRSSFSFTQCRQVLRLVCSPPKTDRRSINAPTLILVGLLGARVDDAKRLKKSSTWGSDTVKIIGAPQLHHLWRVHDADVIASLIGAWIKGSKIEGDIVWSEQLMQHFVEL